MEFAILDNNALSAIGLKGLLCEVARDIPVRLFTTFAQYIDDTPEMFIHTFVSDRIYLEHVDFFSRLGHRVIVLTGNEGRVQNALSINVCQDEKGIVRSLLQLLQQGRRNIPSEVLSAGAELSPREIEVLALIARGYMNKEIADALSISLTTVISHRKNIQEKLHTKTVSGLTVYAVLNGYVDLRDV